MNYLETKQAALNRFFARVNDKQREAIYHTDGALLIIAGAGSGKTTVLCNRIANLLLFGSAYNCRDIHTQNLKDTEYVCGYAEGKFNDVYRLAEIVAEKPAPPYRVLAVTFTNKAANEIKERLRSMGLNDLPFGGKISDIWAGTFHSCCMRILRRDAEHLGYTSNFTVYDGDESARVIKTIMKEFGIGEGKSESKIFASKISGAKDRLITPENFGTTRNGAEDSSLIVAKKVYKEYQRRLKSSNAMDFDDLIMNTVRLLEEFPEVYEKWQSNFTHIMVDEYQDTNHAQYRLLALLAKKHGNFCVVGDEDQSIYKFRGATIQNILNFEKEFDAKVVKLEQNYRSTQTILNAANSVITHNTQRKEKTLWSDLGAGDRICLNIYANERDENAFITSQIKRENEAGKPFSANAVLYRTNAQSMSVETEFIRQNIPYRLVGGMKFFERKEIKDILAYLSLILNPFDAMRLRRVINEPKRGVGDTTTAEVERLAFDLGTSPLDICRKASEYNTLYKKASVLETFGKMIDSFSEFINDYKGEAETSSQIIADLIDFTVQRTGYEDMLKTDDRGEERRQNIGELKSYVLRFDDDMTPMELLTDFIENTALVSELDNVSEEEDKVVLMTIHGAKGLEFETVYLVGAEENIFPSYRATNEPDDLEEERRLAYVAYTRAKKHLYITAAKMRTMYGRVQTNKVSRFVNEIPAEYLDVNDKSVRTKSERPKAPKIDTGYLQNKKKSAVKIADRISTDTATAAAMNFAAGERVSHKIFGEGTVLSVTALGSDDALLEIAFDGNGTKKIGAKFAKVKRV